MFELADVSLKSRLLLGTAQYPSPDIMQKAITASGAQVLTVSISRQTPEAAGGERFWELVRALGCHILPNTAGEKTLHILSFAGGWLGALIAQDKLRHKTQKQPFRAIYWLTVVINVAAFVWTLTPSGQAIFGRWVGEIIGLL